MTFLPIVGRELRVAARRHSTFTTRLMVALAAIVLSVFFYLANLQTPPQQLAKHVFIGLSVWGLIYCLASGRRSTADCLSEEKREGTLGLLFLTDLKGYDVVLGKLTATSLNSFYCLLAIFPVLALPLLFGGVTNGEFWRMVLVLVNSFLFSLAIGIFASVQSHDARQAMGTNLVLLLLLACALPAVAGGVAYFSPNHLFIPALMLPCPAYAFYLSFDNPYKLQSGYFWLSTGTIHALTWGLVVLASRRVPYTWQDRTVTGTKPNLQMRWTRLLYGSTLGRRRLREKLLPVNAFYWLASRVIHKPSVVWAFLGFVGVWWLFVWLELQYNWLDETLNWTMALMLNSILKIWIAIEAGQRLAEDQKQGSLELLLSTPLTVPDILRGQLLALRRQFLWPLVAVIVVQLSFMFAIKKITFQPDSHVQWFGWAGILMLAADVITWPAVAMNAALTAKTPNLAISAALSRVLFLPWLVFVCVCVSITVGMWFATGTRSSDPDWKPYLCFWFLCGIAADVGFGLPAWIRLRTQFRELALHRFHATEPKS